MSGLKTAVLFNGLSKPGIAASDNGGPQFPTPPDSTGAKGPSQFIEITNSVIHMWDSNLNSLQSATLSIFEGQTNPYCDPQVQWDAASNRYLISFLICNTSATSATVQGFYFGWSRTSSPSNLSANPTTGDWCLYGVDTHPNILDYAKLGHNSNYLILAGNFYDMTNPASPPFVGAGIAWASTPAPNATSPCVLPAFNHIPVGPTLKTGDGVTPAYTPVPVNTDTNASDDYIVAAYDPAGNVEPAGSRNKLAVWHLDSGGTFHADPDIVVNAYTTPPPAQQLNGFAIDTLDGRLTQAVGDPTTGIWTQHTVANAGVSKVSWYELALAGGSLSLLQQGDLTNGTDYIFNGTISPSLSGRGSMIEYNRSSSTIHPVIEAQVRAAGTAAGRMAFATSLQLAASSTQDNDLSCNFNGTGVPCRWGDYSGTSPDPAQPYVVWGTNEFNTGSTSQPAWRDQNFALYAAIPPMAPIPVSATASGGGAIVNWTPSTFDAGAPDSSYTITVYSASVIVTTQTVSAPSSGAQITGLAPGCYTFTVTAANVGGLGGESAHTNAVAVGRATCPAPSAGLPPRDPALPGPTPTTNPGR